MKCANTENGMSNAMEDDLERDTSVVDTNNRPHRGASRGRRGNDTVFPVTVIDGDTEIPLEVSGRSVLLAAGLSAGLAWPHSCKAGVCGACKTRLLDGQVRMLPHDSAALDEAEIAKGLILACCARPVSECRVEWLGDSSLKIKERVWRGSITEVEHVTPSIVRIRAEAPDASLFAFNAGQYAHVSINGLPGRDFSLANTPEELALEFHVRDMGTPVSHEIKANAALGQGISVRGPYGEAHLREGETNPMICMGGGSGLAPIESIVRTALLFGMSQPITVYACARSQAELYDIERLEKIASDADHVRIHAVVSEAENAVSSDFRRGFAHDVLVEDFADLSGHTIHVCGPPAMVSAVTRAGKEAGCQRIFSDPFTPHATSNMGEK